MGKTIAITGANGVGKSTFAVNLALNLAQKDKVVILMQTELNYPRLQIFLNEIIPAEKGIKQAMLDKTENPTGFLHQCKKINENLYLMGIENTNEDVYLADIEKIKADSIFRKLNLAADYFIVDCQNDIKNGLSLFAIKKADVIFNLYQVDSSLVFWERSMKPIMQNLAKNEDTIKNIISHHQEACPLKSFLGSVGIFVYAHLPYILHASEYANEGVPIIEKKGRNEKLYKKVIDEIANDLENTGRSAK